MTDETPTGKRRARKAAATTRAATASAAAETPVKQPTDVRRILPTQDWVAKVDRAHLDAVADIQVLAATHFYAGLVRLRKDFASQVLLPPLQSQLPREISGTALLPDGGPGELLAVTIQPFRDANNAQGQVTSTTLTDAQGHFVLR